MKVEVWSDYVCPFCYIGKRRFEAALRQFAHADRVELVFRSFELDPRKPRDGNPNVYDMLASKYGMSREQAIANTQQVARQAKEAGLDFRFDQSIQTNTFDAHRLGHFAAARGKGAAMTERLLKAHFTDGRHLGDFDALADLAADAGLDRDEALEALRGGAYADAARADEREASQLGVGGVPFFVVDRKYAISGAQAERVFLDTLDKAWNEAHPSLVAMGDGAGEMCADDGCAVPERNDPA